GSPLPNGSWPDRVCPARIYSVLGADRKCRFQVVTAERLERDLGLGGEHAGDLINLAGNNPCDVFVFTNPDQGDQIEISVDRIDLADTVDFGDRLRGLVDLTDLYLDENYCGDHTR